MRQTCYRLGLEGQLLQILQLRHLTSAQNACKERVHNSLNVRRIRLLQRWINEGQFVKLSFLHQLHDVQLPLKCFLSHLMRKERAMEACTMFQSFGQKDIKKLINLTAVNFGQLGNNLSRKFRQSSCLKFIEFDEK